MRGNESISISSFDGRLVFPATPLMRLRMRQLMQFLAERHASRTAERETPLAVSELDHGTWKAYGEPLASNVPDHIGPHFTVEGHTVEDLVTILGRPAGGPVTDWEALHDAGISRTTPMNFTIKSSEPLSEIPIESAAQLVGLIAQNDPFYSSYPSIAARPEGRFVEISTPQRLLSTRMYDLRPYFRRFAPEQYSLAANRLIADCPLVGEKSRLRSREGDEFAFVGPELLVTTTWLNQKAIAARLSQFVESAATQPVR
jgi:hypothetical protein